MLKQSPVLARKKKKKALKFKQEQLLISILNLQRLFDTIFYVMETVT